MSERESVRFEAYMREIESVHVSLEEYMSESGRVCEV